MSVILFLSGIKLQNLVKETFNFCFSNPPTLKHKIVIVSLTDLQGTVDFLPKYEVPSPEKKRSVSLLESSLLFLENKWKLQFCRGWEAVVAKRIGAKDNHLLLGCRTPWPVGIPPTANWTWWIVVISELCIFSGFTVFHIDCMMERGEKIRFLISSKSAVWTWSCSFQLVRCLQRNNSCLQQT